MIYKFIFFGIELSKTVNKTLYPCNEKIIVKIGVEKSY